MRLRNLEGISSLSLTLLMSAGLALVLACAQFAVADRARPRSAPDTTARAAPVTHDSIRRTLEAAGFRSIREIRPRGQHFSVEATAAPGLDARIVIHGGTGAILGIRVAESAGGAAATANAGR